MATPDELDDHIRAVRLAQHADDRPVPILDAKGTVVGKITGAQLLGYLIELRMERRSKAATTEPWNAPSTETYVIDLRLCKLRFCPGCGCGLVVVEEMPDADDR